MTVLRTLREWLVWGTARRKRLRRWRDAKVLLVLVLVCVLCQVFGLACGVVGYALQWLGLLPDEAPSPTWDTDVSQAGYLLRAVCAVKMLTPALSQSAVMV